MNDEFTIIYSSECKKYQCDEYIEWEFDPDYGLCKSCMKNGESYDITEYPDDCNFLTEMDAWKKKHEQSFIIYRLRK
jgi:hypothetical protein